jgi:plastocyanin
MPIRHFKSMFGCTIATCFTLVALVLSFSCAAADISVMVVDRQGHGIGAVVVTATPVTATAATPAGTPAATATRAPGARPPASVPAPAQKTAVMDQRNLAFLPRVLVASTGTSVEFPNNDSVSHQVYSFSAAKRFQLPLYKGETHSPVTFDRPGLVVLGCNIHDSMVGYIYVTDAPFFATTEADGGATFKDMPPGDYQVTIWSPFIADAPASLQRTLHLEAGHPDSLRLQVQQPLRAQPEPRPRRRDWDY